MSGDESSVRETPRPLLHRSQGAQKTRASGPRAPPSTSADGPGWPPRTPSSETRKRRLRSTESQGPTAGSLHRLLTRREQHSRTAHLGSSTRLWEPRLQRTCGGASTEGPARLPRVEAAPAPLQPQGLARRRFLLEALSQACPLTEPSQGRLGIPGPPARWLSLAADRPLTFLRSQPRCPLPGLHTGQLPLLRVPGLRSKGGVPRGPLCLQPMGPMPLGPQSQVPGLEVQPGPPARPASGLWRHLPLATAHSPECAPVRGKEQAHGKKLSFKQSRRLGGGSGHVL